MVANVLMENRRSQAIIDTIASRQPDIVFIVENDQWWSDQLADTADDHAHVLDQPQDNTYGLLFMTRLDADEVKLRNITNEAIPSLRARLRLGSGARFTFHGLHPKPPRLDQDTDLRDRELTRVAAEVRDDDGHSIVGGDLNDVAWSHTTRLFKRISNMLDPRRGRGLYASFHADYPVMRWPLDHVFATRDFEINELAVLGHTHSDHFPVYAEFCLQAGTSNNNAKPDPMEGDDREEMRDNVSKRE